MTWTAAVTRITGDLISASDYNGQIIGNLNHLYQRPAWEAEYKVPSDINKTGTTFTDVDATNLKVDITNETPQLMCAAMVPTSGLSGGVAYLDFILDSTTRAGHATYGSAVGGRDQTIPVIGRFTGVTAGSHTIKLQYSTNGTSVGVADEFVHMMVWEL